MSSSSGQNPTIRLATPADAESIAVIYNHYVTHTTVTFEEERVTSAEITRRMADVESASLPWLVAQMDHHIAGYAYAARWKPRSAYRFSVEIAVYVGPETKGRGIGSRLYDRLFPMLQERGIHTVLGGIALPNEPSIALHEKFGFSKVAELKEVGFKFNQWIDVGYWQRTL